MMRTAVLLLVACAACGCEPEREMPAPRTIVDARGALEELYLPAVGDYFSSCAALESASVRSFRRLRRQLAALGAPRSLLHACSRAARDESRHARAMGALARREGGRVSEPREAPLARRSIEALATENAVEGMVCETWGALLASWQAANAKGAAVRGTLGRLARDETRHAALAWSMGAWLESRLEPEAKARVRAARAVARARLEDELALRAPAELVERGLLPSPDVARALARGLASSLPA